MGSVHGEEERGVRLGGAQPELLIPDFPEIKVCISFLRVAVMRSLHCYRGKDMHRFTLQPLRFLGRPPPSLPSCIFHLLAWGATNPFASLCIIARSKLTWNGED